MPSLTESFSVGPKDYSTVFLGYANDDVPEFRSHKSLADWVLGSDLLRRRLLPQSFVGRELSPDELDTVHVTIGSLAFDLLDRFVHLAGGFDSDSQLFDEIVRPVAEAVFSDTLHVDVAIPILFTRFSFEEVRVSERAILRRMGKEFNQARAIVKKYGPGVHSSVLSAATHALFLEGFSFENPGRWQLSQVTDEVAAYPTELIDYFFAALRAKTGVETGFAQLLLVPSNWTFSYEANLPPLVGTSVRSYPIVFEDFYWNRDDLPTLCESQIRDVAVMWRELDAAKENSLRVAARRLNSCCLRDSAEDRAIDATIGLEALLSDNQPHEMTHKLALRVAEVCSRSELCAKAPPEVFREVKQIYAYRSAVVHGSAKSEKKTRIKVSEAEQVPASELALEYLRVVLNAVTENPELRKPTAIDAQILGKLKQ